MDFAFESLYSEKSIFVKFLIITGPLAEKISYKMSPLPGIREGISGSGVSGDNIGIVEYPNLKEYEERKKAAIESFKFITSLKIQKKIISKKQLIPGINSLYFDEDICQNIQCDLFKNLQLIGKPNLITEDYNNYVEQFKNYMFEYLYGEETAENTLKKIDNILKIYYFTVKTDETSIGLITFILLLIIVVVMLLSLIFIFLENYSPFFLFLPQEYWICIVFGSILTLGICFSKYELLTVFKCHLVVIFNCFGFSFSFIPILYKLIINFPENNKVSSWISRHGFLFFIFFNIIDIVLNGLLYIDPYQIHIIYVTRGKNYQVCKMYNKFGKFLLILMILIKIGIIIFIMILSFIEWNIKKTTYDIRFIISSIYIYTLNSTLLLILSYTKINNYIYYILFHSIRGCIVFVMSISNYILMYGYRVIFGIIHKKNLKISFINDINKNFINNESFNSKSEEKHNNVMSSNDNDSSTYENNSENNYTSHNYNDCKTDSNDNSLSNKVSLMSKIMSLHYSTKRSCECIDSEIESKLNN